MTHDNLGRRIEPQPMPEALKDAIATCYGLLWDIHTDDKRVREEHAVHSVLASCKTRRSLTPS